jgi:DNA-binding transcriptional LysR family regulator
VLRVPSFSLLPLIVEHTAAIALVQRRVAERFAQFAEILSHEPPVAITPVQVCVYWSQTHERDAVHAWFKERGQGGSCGARTA